MRARTHPASRVGRDHDSLMRAQHPTRQPPRWRGSGHPHEGLLGCVDGGCRRPHHALGGDVPLRQRRHAGLDASRRPLSLQLPQIPRRRSCPAPNGAVDDCHAKPRRTEAALGSTGRGEGRFQTSGHGRGPCTPCGTGLTVPLEATMGSLRVGTEVQSRWLRSISKRYAIPLREDGVHLQMTEPSQWFSYAIVHHGDVLCRPTATITTCLRHRAPPIQEEINITPLTLLLQQSPSCARTSLLRNTVNYPPATISPDTRMHSTYWAPDHDRAYNLSHEHYQHVPQYSRRDNIPDNISLFHPNIEYLLGYLQ